MDLKKLECNLKGCAKIYGYALTIVVPMAIVKAFFNGANDLAFIFGLILGYIPILAIKVFFYTFVEGLPFHKFSKGILWSFLSAIALVSGIGIFSAIEPPIFSFGEFTTYIALFTVLLFFNYFMLPWKKE
ncbi:hypothetical protein [Pseudoalteromonas phenolica]|uniref:Uncharacterized protein n=1 Tax=Pseudoalteromonas phenolica TaxID=161398 RepID=A0A0S2K834_9GAMM|nr:hypothetical protein [Pseudoalteromonas phenolica]ALO44325.1 hypothetical protein PP2015_3856 [Pseudoalteromonas phenolica]MBE0357327.1 hypothetical protein [Pseudoalteromonas phenolica O-BC30]RXE99610.1 hypothetical protein D9981_09905 [Pseudoalteromonas phenolica O-BC30]